jgi:hypothetical protein
MLLACEASAELKQTKAVPRIAFRRLDAIRSELWFVQISSPYPNIAHYISRHVGSSLYGVLMIIINRLLAQHGVSDRIRWGGLTRGLTVWVRLSSFNSLRTQHGLFLRIR